MTLKKITFGKMEGVPLSGAVRAGDYIFVSGQIPVGSDGLIIDGDISAQTVLVMERIKTLLRDAGCDMSDVVKCNCWLRDVSDFKDFNSVYADYFPVDPPARATVKADLMVDAKVEVDATAWKPI